MQMRWLGLIGLSMAMCWASSASAASPAECKVPKKYATIQLALNDPKCLNIHLGIGTFAEQLTVTRNVEIGGSGARYTTLVAPATMTEPKAMIRVIGRKVKFRIKHVTLVGGGPGAPVVGIRFEKDTKGTVRDTIITDIRQTPMGSSTAFIGIHAGVPGGPQVTALTVDSAIISHSQGAGILIEGQGTVGTITYTLIDGGGDRPASAATPVGIIARNGPLVTVHRTDVIDHRAPAGGGEGIGVLLLDAADSSELTYSNVDRNDRGIHLVSTNKMLIFRNALDHSTGDGIVVEEGIDNDVQRNRVASSGGAGIVVVESQRTTVFSNEVTTNGGGGLVLEASSNNTITSNRADTNTGVGMKDDSRGTKTARTANTWKSNVCQGNSVGDSSPVGLCK